MPTIVHGFLLGAVLLLGAAQSSAAPPVAEDSALAAYRERVITARRVAVELGHTPEEWTAAGVTLKAALGDPMFKQLDAVEQSRVHSGAGWAAIRVGDYIRARDQLLRATQLNPDASVDSLFAGSVNNSRANEDIRNSMFVTIVGDQFVLLDLGKAVRIAPEFRMHLCWTLFI